MKVSFKINLLERLSCAPTHLGEWMRYASEKKNPTKIWMNRASIIYVHTNIELRQKCVQGETKKRNQNVNWCWCNYSRVIRNLHQLTCWVVFSFSPCKNFLFKLKFCNNIDDRMGLFAWTYQVESTVFFSHNKSVLVDLYFSLTTNQL